MAGKEHVSKWITFAIDDEGTSPCQLEDDMVPGSLGAVGLDFERIDMTGSGEAVKRAMGNRANADIEAKFYMNTTADRASDVLMAIDDGVTGGTLTIAYGGTGAPTGTDLEWEGVYVLLRNVIENDGGRLVHNCLWAPDPKTAADPAWGTVS